MILLNDKRIEFKAFGNGEVEPDAQTINSSILRGYTNEVVFKYESDADFLHLEFLKDFIDEIAPGLVVNLKIAYMPYSRMDRTEGTKVFTLKTVAKRINAMKFNMVVVYEPHSDVTPALLDRVFPIQLTKLILPDALEKIGFDKEKDFLCYPDAGAQKRYSMPGFNHVVANKERDWESGRIKNLEIVGDVTEGAKFVIIDDLCSYGGTFMLTAKALKEKGAGEVHLVVAHAEDSIFAGKVLVDDVIDSVHTADTILTGAAGSKLHVKRIIGEGI